MIFRSSLTFVEILLKIFKHFQQNETNGYKCKIIRLWVHSSRAIHELDFSKCFVAFTDKCYKHQTYGTICVDIFDCGVKYPNVD